MVSHLNMNEEAKIAAHYEMTNKYGMKAIKTMKKNTKFLWDMLKQLTIQLDQKVKPFTVKLKHLREEVTLKAGDSFGEYSLLSNKPRNATVYSKSP
jgi:CRP-like cAMP-binding protein